MATTLTSGATILAPQTATGFEGRRGAGTILHQILGSAAQDVTFRPGSRQSGTLELLFLTEAAAKTAQDALATTLAPWALATELTSTSFSLVVTGTVRRTLDPTTRRLWLVAFDFQEI